MKLVSIFVLIGATLILSGCLNTESTPIYYNVEGVVLDNNGNAVTNADIHFRNNYEPGGFLDEHIPEEFIITFSAPEENVYSFELFRFGADTLLTTFSRDTLKAGVQEKLLPDSLLSNGIYAYQVSAPFGPVASGLFLSNKPDSLLPGSLPFTKTNVTGEFTLNSNSLALGQSFNSSLFEGGGFEITDSLQIIVVFNNAIQAKEAIKVEPNQSNFFEITLD